MWRDKKAIKPYILFKGGLLVFDHKAISNHAAYENFSMQSGLGVQTRLTKRVDLRIGLWGDFHFSDGFVVPINPGTDMMNANWGISYHLGAQEAEAGRLHWYSRSSTPCATEDRSSLPECRRPRLPLTSLLRQYSLEVPDQSTGDAAEIGGHAREPVWESDVRTAEVEIGELKAAAGTEVEVPRERRVQATAGIG